MPRKRNRDALFDEILDMLDYDPLDEQVEVARKCLVMAQNAENDEKRLQFLNLFQKINAHLLDKKFANKKSIEIHEVLDEEDLPQTILTDEPEVDPKQLH